MASNGTASRAIPVRIFIFVLLIGAAGASIWKWRTDSAGDPGHLVVSGTIEGEQIAVGSKVSGRLARLLVSEGEVLTAGQLIAEFEIPELVAQQAAAKAQVDVAESTAEKLKNGPRDVDLAQAAAAVNTAKAQLAALVAGSRDEDIASLKAQWQAAEAQYELAAADFRRAQQLFEEDVIARAQLEAAQTREAAARLAADAAKQQYDKAVTGTGQSQLTVARAQVKQAEAAYAALSAGSREEDISAAQAQVAGAQAQLDALQVNEAESQVLATEAGTVLTLPHQAGDLLAPGQAVATLLRAGSYYVQVFIPEDKLGWAQPGVKASFEVDGYEGEGFGGTVTYLAASGEFTPRNLQTKEKRVEQVFRCKLRVDDPEDKLRPGMVCDVVFERPAAAGAGD